MTLKEIEPSCGGNYGSNEIDRKIFDNIIYKLFGYKDFPTILEKYRELDLEEKDESVLFESWCHLENDIKDFKEGVNSEKIKEKDKYPIRCDVFEDFFEEDVKELVDKYNDTLNDKELKLEVKSKKKWIILFPYKILDIYIGEQSDSICEEIKKILKKAKDEINIDINKVIFVGGYSSNEVLTSKIGLELNKNIPFFLKPSNPYLSILEGAVLFGINPNIIETRIAKYTIGMGFDDIWNEEIHSEKGEKYYNEEKKIWMCNDCFYKFIEVNQKLKINEEISAGSLSMTGPRSTTLTFYKSLKPNPIFTFEKGVEQIAECKLDAEKDYPIGERDIKVYMKLGGTFIDVQGVHLKSGKKCKVKFKFD